MKHLVSLPIIEVRRLGYAALRDALGPVDFIRFIQDLRPGTGDYTKERRQWLDKVSISDIARLAQQSRRKRGAMKPVKATRKSA